MSVNAYSPFVEVDAGIIDMEEDIMYYDDEFSWEHGLEPCGCGGAGVYDVRPPLLTHKMSSTVNA
jgi:hypothetical protein